MKIKIAFIFLTLIVLTRPALAKNEEQKKVTQPSCVILLHGLLRSRYAMRAIENTLRNNGYKVWNETYPSGEKPIAQLTKIAIKPALEFCHKQNSKKIHFVTHSLGGILVRKYLQDNTIKNLGKIVMLSPPNHGTVAVDYLKEKTIFKKVFGPAGQQLGTGAESITKSLKPIPGEIGIITGNFSPNPWFSWIIPGEDDGIVSVEGARLPEMQDFIIFNYSHTFIMQKQEVITQILLFLANGQFFYAGEIVDVQLKL